MLKTLVKKQLAELFAMMFGRSVMGKNAKQGNKKGMIVLYIFLFLYVFAAFSVMFYTTSDMMIQALYPAGIGWLCFSYMGIMSLGAGVIGTVFMTNPMLYSAKDNELLLSLPIKPSLIIFARILTLYIMDFVYEALVMIPCIVAYNIIAGFSFASVLCGAVLLVTLPLLSLAIALILGVLIALTSGRIKNKSLITIVLSIGFIVAYFYVVMRMQDYLTLLIANGEIIASKIKTFAYPLYAFGVASEGNVIHLIVFVAIVAAFFALVYYAVSMSYLRLATMKKGVKTSAYREKSYRSVSADRALFGKELSRFWSLPGYVLNSSLGSAFMLVGAVLVVIKGRDISEMISMLPMISDALPLVVAAAIGMISSTNYITAPSISLEGKTMWILRSLPIDPWSVLKGKLCLHLTISGIPALILSLCAVTVIPMDIASRIMIPAFALVITVLFSMIGLWANLRHPSFDWTNEIVPIKQGASVIVAMLGTMGIVGFFAVVYIVLAIGLEIAVPTSIYMFAVIALCALGDALLYSWIRKKGTKIFETF